MRLLSHVWQHANETTPHSWERLNHAMHTALMLAVGSGMEFAEGDLAAIVDRFNGDRWMCAPERFYGEAVVVGNVSAAKSFEAWRKRPAFLADDLQWHCWSTGYVHGSSCRKRDRLFVGVTFPYRGERVTVTSIGTDATVACTYKPRSEGGYENKVAKRFRITLDDLKAERAERKVRERSLHDQSEETTPTRQALRALA